MKTYTKEELANILNLHKMWLNNEEGGVRADLCSADLRNADLRNADLRDADLRYAVLCNADLRNANLRNVDLHYANLRDANLRDANLHYADLRNADLHHANLCNADLRNADLHYANLRNADLRNANLCDADLCCADTNYSTTGIELACPEEGSFIGFKSINSSDIKLLVKLEVPAEAKRSSATTRKCRCEFAKVLEITNVRTGEKLTEYNHYAYGNNTLYKVGEIVYPDSYDENRWNECSNGIHFFTSKNDALAYN